MATNRFKPYVGIDANGKAHAFRSDRKAHPSYRDVRGCFSTNGGARIYADAINSGKPISFKEAERKATEDRTDKEGSW